jgi:hypothetical protein
VNGTVELRDLRTKWYPDGKKHVPADVELSPTACLYWYLEDGSLEKRKNKAERIVLCSMGFSRKENEMLVEKLKKILGFKDGIKVMKRGSIRLNILQAKSFLEYIGGKSPVRCFDYKFDPTVDTPLTEKQRQAIKRRSRMLKRKNN